MERKQLGFGLLAIGILGVVLAMAMDTSVESAYGPVNNLGLMKDQQNYLIIAGLVVIAGLALILAGGDGSASGAGALRPCPVCAEQIQAGAIKCRFCGSEVEPLQAAPDLGSIEDLTATDLQNLAEFYGIRQIDAGYEFRGETHPSLADAVRAARAAR